MFMFNCKEMAWWYWLITVCFLSVGLAGYEAGFLLAIGVTALQLLHFALRERSVTAFPVQVRFFYLVLLLVALPEPLRSLSWLPTVGTWAQVVFGYCAMARTVSLLPWNRKQAFSVGLLKRTYFSRPVRGNILQGLPPIKQTPAP